MLQDIWLLHFDAHLYTVPSVRGNGSSLDRNDYHVAHIIVSGPPSFDIRRYFDPHLGCSPLPFGMWRYFVSFIIVRGHLPLGMRRYFVSLIIGRGSTHIDMRRFFVRHIIYSDPSPFITRRLLGQTRPFSIVATWLGSQYLSAVGLIEKNPGPVIRNYPHSGLIAKGLKIMHLNVRGLINNLSKLKAFMTEVKSPAVWAVTESWLLPENNTELLNIPGYRVERFDVPKRKSMSIAIYVPNEIKVDKFFSRKDKLSHRVWLRIKYKKERYTVGIIYALPASGQLFIETIANEIEEFLGLATLGIITGDFNINMLDIYNPHSVALLNTIKEANLSMVLTDPTRVTKTSATLIDHVYVTETLRSRSSFAEAFIINCEAHISDHNPVGLILTETALARQTPHKHCYAYTPNLQKFDPIKLGGLLASEEWNDVRSAAEVNQQTEIFHRILFAHVVSCDTAGQTLVQRRTVRIAEGP
jgi:hypothetical protein